MIDVLQMLFPLLTIAVLLAVLLALAPLVRNRSLTEE